MTAPLPPLAALLSKLRKSADLSRRQLEDVSGVSEETIKGIEYGRNHRPAPETLRKLATGLAMNRAMGRVDPSAADEMLSSLMQAAHYMPEPRSETARPSVGEMLAAMPRDIAAKVMELVGTDEELVRLLVNELADRTDEVRRSKLRFATQALELSRLSSANHS